MTTPRPSAGLRARPTVKPGQTLLNVQTRATLLWLLYPPQQQITVSCVEESKRSKMPKGYLKHKGRHVGLRSARGGSSRRSGFHRTPAWKSSEQRFLDRVRSNVLADYVSFQVEDSVGWSDWDSDTSTVEDTEEYKVEYPPMATAGRKCNSLQVNHPFLG